MSSITGIRDKIDSLRLDDPTKWTAADLLDKTKQLVEKEVLRGNTARVIVMVCIESKDGELRDTYVAQRGISDDVTVIGWIEMFKAEAIEMIDADLD